MSLFIPNMVNICHIDRFQLYATTLKCPPGTTSIYYRVYFSSPPEVIVLDDFSNIPRVRDVPGLAHFLSIGQFANTPVVNSSDNPGCFFSRVPLRNQISFGKQKKAKY